MAQSILLGIGTGCCGLRSLARILNRQPGTQCSYEEPPWLEWSAKDEGGRRKDEGGRMKDEGGRMKDGRSQAGNSSFIPPPSSLPTDSSFIPPPSSLPTDSSFIPPPSSLPTDGAKGTVPFSSDENWDSPRGRLRARFARFRRNARKDKTLLGDCASFYLPYVEEAIALEPTVRVVCLRRLREEVVKAFCARLDEAMPLPTNHWARRPEPGWHHDPKRTRIYPQYDTPGREDGIGRYWDEYYRRAEELARRYPEHVRVFESAEVLGTEEGLGRVLGFAGSGGAKDEEATPKGERPTTMGADNSSLILPPSSLPDGPQSLIPSQAALTPGPSPGRRGEEADATPVGEPPPSRVPKSLNPLIPASAALTPGPSPGMRGEEADATPVGEPPPSRVPKSLNPLIPAATKGTVPFSSDENRDSPRPRARSWARPATGDPLDPRRCAVLVPFATSIVPQCERALVELERRGYEVRRVGGYAAIDQGRNQMATDALLDGYEETFWIDADVEFHPDAVGRLRGHRLPMVCGIYPQKGKRAVACHSAPGTPRTVFGKGGGLVEILYAGAGFLLVRREVYLAIQEQLRLPMCNERFGVPLLPFFHPMLHACDDGHWYLAEDWAFCERARQCGYQIVADTTVRLWHIGSYAFGWEDAGMDRRRFDTFTLNYGPTQDKSASSDENGDSPRDPDQAAAPVNRDGA